MQVASTRAFRQGLPRRLAVVLGTTTTTTSHFPASLSVVLPTSLSLSSSRASLSTSSSVPVENSPVAPIYVHHVSKTVLEYLQEIKSDWLVEQGLDRGLRLAANGTFVLHFPSRPGFDAGRIWTSYDTSSQQHWLSVYRQKVVGRFLLKDGKGFSSSQTTVTTSSSHKARQRIQMVVDEMIVTLDQQQQQQQTKKR